MTIEILDRTCPDEAHLPPSARTWARLLVVDAMDVLELRDPASGQDPDPASKPRHQYAVARGCLWTRRLPPAALDQPLDDAPWADDPNASRWRLVAPAATLRGMWEWAMTRGVLPYPIEREIYRDGGGESYLMPPAHPHDVWSDITGVPCPVEGCGQTLVWYEAGYVPGYRVCMAHISGDEYDAYSLRHRFALDHHHGVPDRTVLIREEEGVRQ